MSEPAIDAERLAALLDGRLDGRERDELLGLLASSRADLEVFAGAAAVMAELEGSRDEDGVVPLRPRERAHRRPGARWLALAAVIAAVAVAPSLWMRVRTPDISDPGRFVSALADDEAGLPGKWDSHPWTSTRSGGSPLTDEARAARVGALLVDLELAVRTSAPATEELALEIATLLEEVPAAGRVAAAFHEVARRTGEPSEELQPLLAQERPQAVRLVGADLAGLGAWAETGRIAAARRDADFFRTRASRTALERAAGLPGLPNPARSALQRIRSASDGGRPPDWIALERDLGLVLRAFGG